MATNTRYLVRGARADDAGPKLEGLLKDHGATFRDTEEGLVVEFTEGIAGTAEPQQLRSALETALSSLDIEAAVEPR